MWIGDCCYPCYPKEIGVNPIKDYHDKLRIGLIFAYNDYAPKLVIYKFILNKHNTSIFIMCEREGDIAEMEGYHPWSIYEITFQNGSFYHNKIDAYLEYDDACKYFAYLQGKEILNHAPIKEL